MAFEGYKCDYSHATLSASGLKALHPTELQSIDRPKKPNQRKMKFGKNAWSDVIIEHILRTKPRFKVTSPTGHEYRAVYCSASFCGFGEWERAYVNSDIILDGKLHFWEVVRGCDYYGLGTQCFETLNDGWWVLRKKATVHKLPGLDVKPSRYAGNKYGSLPSDVVGIVFPTPINYRFEFLMEKDGKIHVIFARKKYFKSLRSC